MNSTELENLSAAELKSRREELAEAIKGENGKTLATRFIAARIDAKLRDEKLAEQGVTISNLNAALEQTRAQLRTESERANVNAAAVAAGEQALRKAEDAAGQECRKRQEVIDGNLKVIEGLTAENKRLEALAKARRAALADVMAGVGKLNEKVAPLLAAE